MKLTKKKFYYCPDDKEITDIKCPVNDCDYKYKKNCNNVYKLVKQESDK